MQSDHISGSDDQPIEIHGRTFQLYWCYQCHRTVRIATDSPQIMCPRCFGRFVYEVNIARPRLVVEFTQFDPSPEARLLEALSLMLDPPVRPTANRHHDIRIQLPWTRRGTSNSRFDDMDGWGPDTGILARPRSRSWVILAPNNLPQVRNDSNHHDNEPEGRVPRGVDPRNYYEGSELHELMEQLTQNDRPGPPPAPDSAINALPNVKITQAHLLNDSQSCAVCMEDFKIDGEAKELPCNHIFHSNCIVPWLTLHNSCPVCRNELPVQSVSTDSTSDSSDEEVDSRGRRRRCWRWRRLASIWPVQTRFRHHGSHVVTNNITSREDSRVNSCSIL
ncbi:hypothetical protein R6Q57_012520 [Mikania cordata]